jgi:hypothetical protein
MAYTNIDDPSAYFQTLAYTASTATPSQTFTNDGNSDLKPDFLWIKNRAGWGSRSHSLFDSSRGVNKRLKSNATAAEDTTSYQTFNTDGFTVPEGFEMAYSGPYVAWQWKANGGTTATNTDGAINSTVQVNADAGFSILTYTMGSGNETVGHGLGVKPDIVITKARQRGDVNGFWSVYTTLIDGSLDYLKLNDTNAKANSSLAAPTTTVFTGAGSGTVAYRSFVAYCFASKQGYSKFGKYVGNGSANGPFVYTGFKPAFVMCKNATTAGDNWEIRDNKRNDFNPQGKALYPNLTAAEYNATAIATDSLSNGFKVRATDHGLNESGQTYIFMCFAENPFVTSTGIPTTAR